MRITAISDTHTKHNQLELPGGDLIIHAGDFSSMGYLHEIKNFCEWFRKTKYAHKVYIAGNHELGFRDYAEETYKLIENYELSLDYLEDQFYGIDDFDDSEVKIYGSPWQPEFCNWAFNLPRNGQELYQRWANIPLDTDILITHGPPFGVLDRVIERTDHLGCQLLSNRLQEVKPKIHIFGHIHTGYGYYFDGITHYINAAVLNEQYKFTNTPLTFDWDPGSNEIEFVSIHGRS
jgi:predicted phosphohydrolase